MQRVGVELLPLILIYLAAFYYAPIRGIVRAVKRKRRGEHSAKAVWWALGLLGLSIWTAFNGLSIGLFGFISPMLCGVWLFLAYDTKPIGKPADRSNPNA